MPSYRQMECSIIQTDWTQISQGMVGMPISCRKSHKKFWQNQALRAGSVTNNSYPSFSSLWCYYSAMAYFVSKSGRSQNSQNITWAVRQWFVLAFLPKQIHFSTKFNKLYLSFLQPTGRLSVFELHVHGIQHTFSKHLEITSEVVAHIWWLYPCQER